MRPDRWSIFGSGTRAAMDLVESDVRRLFGWPTLVLPNGDYPPGSEVTT